jgi:hypothetical protein
MEKDVIVAYFKWPYRRSAWENMENYEIPPCPGIEKGTSQTRVLTCYCDTDILGVRMRDKKSEKWKKGRKMDVGKDEWRKETNKQRREEWMTLRSEELSFSLIH